MPRRSKQLLDDNYEKDRGQFIQKLQEFHNARGTTIGQVPRFGGQPLDLFALYKTVTSFGGIAVTTDKQKWGQVFSILGFPPCTNAEYALRQHYARYLEAYERIYFFGEDADDLHDNNQSRSQSMMFRYRRLNKAPKLSSLGEPLVDNFNRISYSLQSGLQNEVNFSLNICSLLSNVSNSIFNLAKSPKILDLILAHAGIWSQDNSYTKMLYKEWYKDSDKNFEKFWLSSLDADVATELYKKNFLDVDAVSSDEPSQFFVTKKSEKSEQCRINQICIVLYNFSFELINAIHLANHGGAVRFLLLCCCCTSSSIRRTGLDAFDNISDQINLIGVENQFTQALMQILYNFLKSNDKFRRVRAMSILAKLASKEENSKILTKTLTTDTYQSLVQMLHLPDVPLILASLDALYFLSGLNEITSTSIAMVQGSIEILVCLITIRAESFGNRAIQGFRIVENKLSIFTPKNQNWLKAQEERRRQVMHHPMAMGYLPGMNPHAIPRPQPTPIVRPMLQNMHPPQPPLNPMTKPVTPNEPLVELDAEIFAAHWMSGFYEPHDSNKLSISAIYEDYCNACKECKRNGILSLDGFTDVLRTILPPNLAQIVALGDGKLGISGIQRRKTPVYVHSKVPKQMHEHLVRNKQALAGTRKLQPLPITNNPNAETNSKPEMMNEDSNISIASSCLSKSSDSTDKSAQEGDETSLILAQNEKTTPVENAKATNGSTDVQSKLESLQNQPVTTIAECQSVINRLKGEIESHFVQFHVHRQQIQVVQMQIQQMMSQSQVENLPANVVKDIQSRVQVHHTQMGAHYQKLQELNVLSEQVHAKMQQYKKLQGIEDDKSQSSPLVHDNLSMPGQHPFQMSMPNSSMQSPIASLQHQVLGKAQAMSPNLMSTNSISVNQQQRITPGSSFIVPAAVPFMPLDGPVSIQHSVPTNIPQSQGIMSPPTTPLRGRGSRGGRIRTGSPRGRGSRGGRGSRSRARGIRGLRGSRGSPRGKRGSPMNQQHVMATNGLEGMSPMNPVSAAHSPLHENNFVSRSHQNIPMSPVVNSPMQLNSQQMNPRPQYVMQMSNQVSHINSPNTRLPSPMTNRTSNHEFTYPGNSTATKLSETSANQSFVAQLQNSDVSNITHCENPSSNHNLNTSLPVSSTAQSVTPLTNNVSVDIKANTLNGRITSSNHDITADNKTLLSSAKNSDSSETLSNKEQSHTVNCTQIPYVPIASHTNTSNQVNSTHQTPVLQPICSNPVSASSNILNNSIHPISPKNCSEKEDLIAISETKNNKLFKIDIENTEQNNSDSQINNAIDFTNLNGKHDIIDKKDENSGVSPISKKRLLVNGDPASDRLETPRKYSKLFDDLHSLPTINGLSEKAKLLNGKLTDVNIVNNIIVNRVKLEEKCNVIQEDNFNTTEHSKTLKKVNGLLSHDDKTPELANGRLKGENRSQNGTIAEQNEHKPEPLLHEEKPSVSITQNGHTNSIQNSFSTIDVFGEGNGRSIFAITKSVIEDLVKEVSDNEDNYDTHFVKELMHEGATLLNDSQNVDDKNLTKLNGLRLDLQNPTSDLFPHSSSSDSNKQSSTPNSQPSALSSTNSNYINLQSSPTRHQFCTCEWEGCKIPPFKKANDLLAHMILVHAPQPGLMSTCQVTGCKTNRKPRGGMITHFQEVHCLVKRDDGNLTTVPLPDPASMRTRNNIQHEDESPVTRSVRYTAALILRNIVKHSPYGKSLLLQHETKLAAVAMSTSEAAIAVCQCLQELTESSVCEDEEEEEFFEEDELVEENKDLEEEVNS